MSVILYPTTFSISGLSLVPCSPFHQLVSLFFKQNTICLHSYNCKQCKEENVKVIKHSSNWATVCLLNTVTLLPCWNHATISVKDRSINIIVNHTKGWSKRWKWAKPKVTKTNGRKNQNGTQTTRKLTQHMHNTTWHECQTNLGGVVNKTSALWVAWKGRETGWLVRCQMMCQWFSHSISQYTGQYQLFSLKHLFVCTNSLSGPNGVKLQFSWVGPGQSWNPQRWEIMLRMHLKTIFLVFWKISESWNPAVAWKVPSNRSKLQFIKKTTTTTHSLFHLYKHLSHVMKFNVKHDNQV